MAVGERPVQGQAVVIVAAGGEAGVRLLRSVLHLRGFVSMNGLNGDGCTVVQTYIEE